MDKAYARCKGCDKGFYPAWRARLQVFEELCDKCRQSSSWAARVDPDLFKDEDNWNSEKDKPQAEQDTNFIEGLVTDYNPINDDMWREDEYLEYGEGAMGDLGLFDR